MIPGMIPGLNGLLLFIPSVTCKEGMSKRAMLSCTTLSLLTNVSASIPAIGKTMIHNAAKARKTLLEKLFFCIYTKIATSAKTLHTIYEYYCSFLCDYWQSVLQAS